jgi:DNA mismatch repair protein MutL
MDSLNGTEITVQGGKITKVSDAGAPMGTMITVSQLFYNIPARRKFLKTIGTEMGHISDTVAGIALGRPDIGFKLIHEGKTVKDWPATHEPEGRVVEVLGKEVRDSLLPIDVQEDILSATGWLAEPGFTRSTSRGIYVYVNGRHVKDRIIHHALLEGFGKQIAKGKFPLAVLFLTVPFDQVDVNVHPAKHEVRFSRQKEIHDILKRAVSGALSRSEKSLTWVPVRKRDEIPRVSEPVSRYEKETTAPLPEVKTNKNLAIGEAIASRSARQSDLWRTKHFEGLRVIGQLHNTYILCESRDGLILIDQHAAHERILFEQIKNKSEGQNAERQNLLMPETFEVGYREADILEKLIPNLQTAGVDIENFGKETFVVKSVPSILFGKEIKPVILEIVEKMADIGFAHDIQEAVDTSLVLMACHGAIRANQPLSEEQMKGIIDQLDQCDDPSHCPHGRPTWITWSSAFLEKSFGRTGK